MDFIWTIHDQVLIVYPLFTISHSWLIWNPGKTVDYFIHISGCGPQSSLEACLILMAHETYKSL